MINHTHEPSADTNAPGRVIVIGSLNIDTVLEVGHHPRVGETISALRSTTMPGGKGGNQAAAAAAAGASVVMIGAVGEDGERYVRHLATLGIDTTGVSIVPDHTTGSAIVMVDQEGANSIIVAENANAAVSAETIHDFEFRPGDVLSVQLELPLDLVRAAMQGARSAGAEVILNPSPWKEDARSLLPLADVVVVNEIEALEVEGTISEAALCVTEGSRGARWGSAWQAAPRINAIDTTGAGDTFAGTLAASLTAGQNPDRALASAVGAASQACLALGAQVWTAR